ncbi:MAG: ATP synthase subunit I [Gammaproteobacteria bacterium]|nr:ATP synthase subunit I [Gammaproteobacteria bacterium]MBU1656028.1 ATP synthase subunit I [Gammaproteobacteria bacterium]MBU1962236.1 ATP synthase subunit I [Gammaproteobacteria bacterium]
MVAYPHSGREKVEKLLVLQMLAALTVPLFFLLGGSHSALSAALGAGIALLACAVQAIKIFGPYRAQNPDDLLGLMLFSEAAKMVTVGALFAMSFHFLEWVRPVPIFCGFIIVYLTPLPTIVSGLWERNNRAEPWLQKP